MEKTFFQRICKPNPLGVDCILWVAYEDKTRYEAYQPGCITTVMCASSEFIKNIREKNGRPIPTTTD